MHVARPHEPDAGVCTGRLQREEQAVRHGEADDESDQAGEHDARTAIGPAARLDRPVAEGTTVRWQCRVSSVNWGIPRQIEPYFRIFHQTICDFDETWFRGYF